RLRSGHDFGHRYRISTDARGLGAEEVLRARSEWHGHQRHPARLASTESASCTGGRRGSRTVHESGGAMAFMDHGLPEEIAGGTLGSAVVAWKFTRGDEELA